MLQYILGVTNRARELGYETAPAADSKPFARLVVASALIEALEGLDLQFPTVDAAALKELQKVRAALVS